VVYAAPDPAREVPSIRVRAVGDGLAVASDGPVVRHVYDGGIPTALARWADQVVYGAGLAPPRPVPPMWCSWYCYWDKVTDAQVLENLGLFDDAGISAGIVQIDDGYQGGIGDWLDVRAGFGDLAGLARRIPGTGRRAGIWTVPLLAGQHSRLYAEQPGWMVGGADAGYGTFRDMGFSLYKVDFMYAGALPGRRHDDRTPFAAYRRALEIIREAVGPEAIILGCGAPIFPSLGLVDVMRVSPDTAATLFHESGDASMPSSRNAIRAGSAREWQHGRFWVNDPDCLIVRPGVQEREQWATWIGQSAGLRTSSDPIAALDDWGLATTRRLLRPSGPAVGLALAGQPPHVDQVIDGGTILGDQPGGGDVFRVRDRHLVPCRRRHQRQLCRLPPALPAVGTHLYPQPAQPLQPRP
jgi:alpha-galactosidase